MFLKHMCTNLTSNEIFSLAIVGILTADVHTENLLYNNTPSKAIVNAASNITYRPIIEADDTGR